MQILKCAFVGDFPIFLYVGLMTVEFGFTAVRWSIFKLTTNKIYFLWLFIAYRG